MRIVFFRIIGVIFFLGLLKPVLSQTYSNKVSSILSFNAGMTSSNIINDKIDSRSGISYSAGLGYYLMLNDRFNAGIELLYTGKAFKTESPIVKFRYYYADIPLVLQMKFGENLRLNAGAQYSYSTNSHMIILDPSKPNGVRSTKISAIKINDYSVLGGLEFDINDLICVGARYTISTSAFLDSKETAFSVFMVSVKYSPVKTYKVLFRKKETQQ
jgi:hypothetical protein